MLGKRHVIRENAKKHAHFLHEPCKKDVLFTFDRGYAIKQTSKARILREGSDI